MKAHLLRWMPLYVPIDPLKFVDKKSYKKRVEEAESKTGRTSSVVSGECTINGVGTQLVIFDFSFMGGSLGSVEGEKIVRAISRAIEKKTRLYYRFGFWWSAYARVFFLINADV